MTRPHGLAVRGRDGLVHWDGRATKQLVAAELRYHTENQARFYIDCVWYSARVQGDASDFVSTDCKDVTCLQCTGLGELFILHPI
jgi:hypothetical protein